MTYSSTESSDHKNMSLSNDTIVVGIITNIHGVKGNVKLKSFTENLEDIFSFDFVTTKTGKRIKLQKVGVQKDIFLAKIEGVTTRTEAEEFKGLEIFLSRDALPKLESSEFYHTDIIGALVEDINGKAIGIVKDVVNYGAGDIVDITMNETGKEEMFLLEKDVVNIDLENRKIVLDIPTYLEVEK